MPEKILQFIRKTFIQLKRNLSKYFLTVGIGCNFYSSVYVTFPQNY